jgi:hypothetical protein
MPRKLVGVHPRMTISSTDSVTLKIDIAGHQEAHPFVVAPMGHDMGLNQPWLQRHDPLLRHRDPTITFNSQRCLEECLRYPAPLQVPLCNANGQQAVACVRMNRWQICKTNPGCDATTLQPRTVLPGSCSNRRRSRRSVQGIMYRCRYLCITPKVSEPLHACRLILDINCYSLPFSHNVMCFWRFCN